MKTFALALCILVLAVTIQDISARPRRGPQGQRGEGQRGEGQRGQGQRGQGQRGQGQRGQDEAQVGLGQGQRGASAEGRRHGRPKFLGGVCKVQNATTLDVLCDNSTRCRNAAECSSTPAAIGDLLIHSCIPMVCDPEISNVCPNGTNCSSSPIDTEFRCIRNEGHHRRNSGSSSEESSSESDEDIEGEEENEVEVEGDEDVDSCRVFDKVIRGKKGSGGPGTRGRGRGEGGNGGIGDGQGRNEQDGLFGATPLRQGQGLEGQMTNGGLGQEPEGNTDLDSEEDSSVSSEELPRGIQGNRGNQGNRRSAGVSGQRRGRRQP